MAQRANAQELETFCNKVRAAGGGEMLSGLMPSVPGNSKECIIARNLNFGCKVDKYNGEWYMEVDSYDLATRIAEAMELNQQGLKIWLPSEIGQVAEDFDEYSNILEAIMEEEEDLKILEGQLEKEKAAWKEKKEQRMEEIQAQKESIERATKNTEVDRELWGYIEESRKELLNLNPVLKEKLEQR